MSADLQTRDLVVTRSFNASLDRVWKAWSNGDDIQQWWGPNGFTAPLARMDFREGGTSLVCMSSPQFGDQYSTWHYTAIVPSQRIEYIHNLADKDGHTVDPTTVGMPPDFPQNMRQAVTFKALEADRTEITVTEYDWPLGRMREMSQLGLEQCLDKMAALVEKT